MTEKKNILMVLFADKDIVKGLGAKWDASKKQWYFMGVLPDELKKYISYVVDVPFDDKDIFKKKIPSLRWSPDEQKEDVTSVAKVRWPLAAGKRREHPDPAYYENLFEWIGVTLVLQAISNAGRTASLKTSVKCH